MKRHALTTTLCLLLRLSLVLGSVARGLATSGQILPVGGVTELVICSGGGSETILIDARGNPVDPEGACRAHHCALCFTADKGALLVGAIGLVVSASTPRLHWPVVSRFIVSVSRLRALARTPPFKGQTA